MSSNKIETIRSSSSGTSARPDGRRRNTASSGLAEYYASGLTAGALK